MVAVDQVKAQDEYVAAWTAIHAAQASGKDFAAFTESAIEPRLGLKRPKRSKKPVPRSI